MIRSGALFRGFLPWIFSAMALVASPAFGATVEYLHTDALGSIVAVTNSAGQVIERREYEPYGRQLAPTPVADGPGYTGHVSDAATGLDYMQQRYYDPILGVMLSADPVTAYGGDMRHFNLYSYAFNNPYKFYDPDGRKPSAGSLCDKNKSFCKSVISVNSNSNGGIFDKVGINNKSVALAQVDPNTATSRIDESLLEENNKNRNQLASDEVINLANALGSIYEARKAGTGMWGKIFVAKDYADLSAGTLNLTIRWGLKDIQTFRATDGLHHPYMQGSLIRWNLVDWNRVDPGPGERFTPEQVMGRFFRMVEHGEYP